MSDLPKIEHAEVNLNERNRVEVKMHDGYVFYRLDSYPEGTPQEDICYSTWGSFSPTTDIKNILIVVERTPEIENQIY